MTMETEQQVQIEQKKTRQNFRFSDEVQDFYRFVNDSNLRREAQLALSKIFHTFVEKKKAKSKTRAKRKLH